MQSSEWQREKGGGDDRQTGTCKVCPMSCTCGAAEIRAVCGSAATSALDGVCVPDAEPDADADADAEWEGAEDSHSSLV